MIISFGSKIRQTDIEILLHIKFHQSLICCFEEKFKRVSANQRPGLPSLFSDQPKNTSLVEDVEFLQLPIKFPILFSSCIGEFENLSANHRMGDNLCFPIGKNTYLPGRGRCARTSYQVSSNSAQRFQRISRKCGKVTTDGRRTTHNRTFELESLIRVHLNHFTL